VFICRAILALLISVAMLVAQAPASAAHCASSGDDAHDCCKKQQPCESSSHKDKCGSHTCAMQCCRVIPAPPDAVEALLARTLTHQVADVPPPALHSLIEPEAIYHPPRA
jgi:hypothetical protein